MNLADYITGEDDKIALIDTSNWERPIQLSYGKFREMVGTYAAFLLNQGLKTADRVAIASENRAEFIAAWYGIMQAGLVAVPVNHKLPKDIVKYILEDSGARLMLCDQERASSYGDIVTAIEWQACQVRPPANHVRIDVNEPDPATILYTSGSTGRPKGVPLTHGGYRWVLETRLRDGPHAHHRLLVAAPLYHMNALCSMQFCLAAGASAVLLPRFNVGRYIEAIPRFHCTWLTSVAAMMAMVVRERDKLLEQDLSSVQIVRMGSAPVTKRMVDDVRAAFPGAAISNSYGTTEAGPAIFGAHADGRRPPGLSVGWPLPGVECKLLDTDGSEVNTGVLWVRCPANTTGYLNLPEATRGVVAADGWLNTNDIFTRDDDGLYWFAGRADDMFVCGGENVYPQEVERLLESHPDVAQACVVPIPDDIKGAKPYAFVVRRTGSTAATDDIKRFALERGPAYSHPRHVEFLSEIPLAGTNKVDRHDLLRRALRSLGANSPNTTPHS